MRPENRLCPRAPACIFFFSSRRRHTRFPTTRHSFSSNSTGGIGGTSSCALTCSPRSAHTHGPATSASLRRRFTGLSSVERWLPLTDRAITSRHGERAQQNDRFVASRRLAAPPAAAPAGLRAREAAFGISGRREI